MSVTVRESGGMYVADIRFDDEDDILHTTDPAPSAETARGFGESWVEWFDGLSEGRVESSITFWPYEKRGLALRTGRTPIRVCTLKSVALEIRVNVSKTCEPERHRN